MQPLWKSSRWSGLQFLQFGGLQCCSEGGSSENTKPCTRWNRCGISTVGRTLELGIDSAGGTAGSSGSEGRHLLRASRGHLGAGSDGTW